MEVKLDVQGEGLVRYSSVIAAACSVSPAGATTLLATDVTLAIQSRESWRARAW
jgi:hypothetical protein